MDILRKELNDIYSAQRLGLELLPSAGLTEVREMAAAVVKATDACAVITDASCVRCYIFGTIRRADGLFRSHSFMCDGRFKR